MHARIGWFLPGFFYCSIWNFLVPCVEFSLASIAARSGFGSCRPCLLCPLWLVEWEMLSQLIQYILRIVLTYSELLTRQAPQKYKYALCSFSICMFLLREWNLEANYSLMVDKSPRVGDSIQVLSSNDSCGLSCCYPKWWFDLTFDHVTHLDSITNDSCRLSYCYPKWWFELSWVKVKFNFWSTMSSYLDSIILECS